MSTVCSALLGYFLIAADKASPFSMMVCRVQRWCGMVLDMVGSPLGLYFYFLLIFYWQWADSVLQVLGWRFTKRKTGKRKADAFACRLIVHVSRKPWGCYFLNNHYLIWGLLTKVFIIVFSLQQIEISNNTNNKHLGNQSL